ncbi:MAG: DUF4416 family protein [candidate division Zixibacteria bacterium]|nr:DUF4416 family protein [candidate division Zixibacteria bacterium]
MEPLPGRLIVSVIYSSMDAIADALGRLEDRFGRVQYETGEIVCSNADRYREEMGDGLLRRFFSFERPVARSSLVDIKAACHKIEPQFADKTDDFLFRAVNIDPGILTLKNLVMASHLDSRQQIYLGDFVFAEIALIYTRDHFVRMPWTDPDFYTDEAIDFFERVRDNFEVVEQVL